MSKYEQLVAQAPATTPELFKAAILTALADIDERLSQLEPQPEKEDEENGL
jgi:hypothetical protein